jgi:hypothetical protein
MGQLETVMPLELMNERCRGEGRDAVARIKEGFGSREQQKWFLRPPRKNETERKSARGTDWRTKKLKGEKGSGHQREPDRELKE